MQVDFARAGKDTEVRVTHTGLGTEPAWANAAVRIGRGWEAALENLQSILETEWTCAWPAGPCSA